LCLFNVCMCVINVSQGTRALHPTEFQLGRASGSVRNRMLNLGASDVNRAYRLAGLLLRDQHEAQDATQEAMLRAWRSADSLRDMNGFQAWFDRILVNVCLDRRRQKGRVRLVSIDESGPTVSSPDPFKRVFDKDEVFRAMEQLSDEERVVIVLHYWADLTIDGMASRLGWPVGTTKSRLNRALTKLRDRVVEPVPMEVRP
jgi:RNA polymerase sigma-70 factor (ECF subfamily)